MKEYPEDSPEDRGMGNGEIDRLTISQLIERYRLARSAVYKRIEALGIEAKKNWRQSFLQQRPSQAVR